MGTWGLQACVAVHNALLCIVSIVLSFGTLFAVFQGNPYSSLEQFFCLPQRVPIMPANLNFWVWAFYVSKYWELLDTVLLVIRKRPLSFLHVYHHAIVIPEI